MKIGIFDPYIDDIGGGEKYMMTIAEVLSGYHNVHVFWDVKEDIKNIEKRFSLDLSRIKIVENIFSSKIPVAKKLFRTKDYDAIIILSDGSIPFVLSKKLFIHVQQPLPFVKINSKTKLKIARVSRFFCNSQFTKSYIDKTFGIKSLVIYPPVGNFRKKVKKENIILTVGRFRLRDVLSGLSDFKKQTTMISVFKEMIRDGLKNWRFVLAVSVKDEEWDAFQKVKNECTKFPIEFLVNKSNITLWETYSKAKIYWHASGFGEDLGKNPHYAEHFGISTVEAMGAGAVPVVINAGGQREIVDDGENGLLWDSLSELKEKTLTLIKNPEKLRTLSENALEKAKIFDKE